MLVAFLAYKVHFATRTAALVDKFFQFRLARIHLQRLEDIVETPSERFSRVSGAGRDAPQMIDGFLALRDISFRYGRNEPFVFEGLNLSVDAGEQVALAGPSGSGKSTVLKIMVGLVRASRGEVLVDGHALGDFGLPAYRRQIGVVMQNDQLLSGTIIDNVAFFAQRPDLAKVEAACHRAGILDEILRMPMGLYTLLGDMGEVLSGGQKQRLLLARALYRDPAILFLDEATSHLDAAGEARLVREIAGLEITRVVAAHRAETLRHADRIIDLGSLGRT
jgi:ATP-binding cassette subfamily B protein RaxB